LGLADYFLSTFKDRPVWGNKKKVHAEADAGNTSGPHDDGLGAADVLHSVEQMMFV